MKFRKRLLIKAFISFLYKLFGLIKWHKYPTLRVIHKFLWEGLRILTLRKNPFYITSNYSVASHQINSSLNGLKEKGFAIIDHSVMESGFESVHNQIISSSKDILSTIDINLFNKSGKNFLRPIDFKYLNVQYILSLYKYFSNDYFIGLASNYLGDQPLITDIKILKSSPINSTKFAGSQCWHCDHDDTKIIKIFVYLNDVTKEDGPLEIIDRKNTKKILIKNNYRWGGPDSHDDSLVEEYTKVSTIVGSEGTVIAADTCNCLHRGSRNAKGDRLILYASYCTRTSFRFKPLNWLVPILFYSQLTRISSPLTRIEKLLPYLDSYAINK